VSLRFFAGGGMPPESHEVLRAEPDGTGWYLTGMPWPEQPPFDEIGAYTAELGARGYERLAELARAAIAAPPASERTADGGVESVRLDGAEASWGPRDRSPAAAAFVAAAREAIAAARGRPFAVAGAELGDGRVVLRNRGAHPLPVTGGEARGGWGRADRPPPPLRLAVDAPRPVELPVALEPGAAVELALPPRGPVEDEEFATAYALISLRWRPGVEGEPDELDGWLIAGPHG
jgi:hypothetical protein